VPPARWNDEAMDPPTAPAARKNGSIGEARWTHLKAHRRKGSDRAISTQNRKERER